MGTFHDFDLIKNQKYTRLENEKTGGEKMLLNVVDPKLMILQDRLNSIGRILDPNDEMPEHVKGNLDLDYRSDPETYYYMENDNYIIEVSERGTRLMKQAHEDEDDFVFTLVNSFCYDAVYHVFSEELRNCESVEERKTLRRKLQREWIAKVSVDWAERFTKAIQGSSDNKAR